MRRHTKLLTLLAGGTAFVLALPVLGQDAPQSLLPPGFGNSPPPRAEKTDKAAAAVPPAQAPPAAPAPVGPLPAPTPGADEGVAESSPDLLPSDIASLA